MSKAIKEKRRPFQKWLTHQASLYFLESKAWNQYVVGNSRNQQTAFSKSSISLEQLVLLTADRTSLVVSNGSSGIAEMRGSIHHLVLIGMAPRAVGGGHRC